METGKAVMGVVRNSGQLGERKVVNVSGLTVHSKHSSMQDLADIQNFAVKFNVDFVAASQCHARSDVEVGGHVCCSVWVQRDLDRSEGALEPPGPLHFAQLPHEHACFSIIICSAEPAQLPG